MWKECNRPAANRFHLQTTCANPWWWGLRWRIDRRRDRGRSPGRVHLGGPGQHRVGGASFFRIRKLDSGKVRIRLELLVHQVDVGDARGVQGGHGGGATDPVKCGEDDTQVACAAAHRRGALNIGIDQGLAGGLDRGAGI